MILLLPHAPLAVGTYVSTIGRVGAGGMETSITLRTDGGFTLRSRGCFLNETRSGTYRQSGETVELTDPQRPDEKRSFRLRLHAASIFLVEDAELRAIAAGESTYDLCLRRRDVQPAAPTTLVPLP